MEKKDYKGRIEKRRLSKSKDVCRFYSKIQSAYGDKLEQDESIEEIVCNQLMDGLDIGEYTSDFVCKKTNQSYMVRECVQRRLLAKPLTVKRLDASRNYWISKGVTDWGIVVEKEN